VKPDEKPFHEPVVEQRKPYTLGVSRGMVTAEMRRQQSAAAKEAIRAVRLGGAAKPKKRPKAK
jgi:hypothetical protein